MNINTIKKGVMALEEAVYKAGEYNPHNVRAWAIGNEFGLLGVVVAAHEAESLDAAVDGAILDSMLMSPEDQETWIVGGHEAAWMAEELFTYAGNAGEAVWTEHLTIQEIDTGAIYHETIR